MIVAVPVAFPVTTPEASTVAIAVSLLDQLPPVVPFDVNVVVPATQIV
ncbi:hypothetical protein QQY79_23545 [Flavobacterium tructae]|nr:hypothetical protein [Flavobacterium tructae]MDL2145507.1 hypothetical protein [Flavobacterium tructae]